MQPTHKPGSTPRRSPALTGDRNAGSPQNQALAPTQVEGKASRQSPSPGGPAIRKRDAASLPTGAATALFVQLTQPVQTTADRDALVREMVRVAPELSLEDASGLGRQLVTALGQQHIENADLGAIVRPLVDALARGELGPEQAKALLRGVVQGTGGPQTRDAHIAVYLDAAARGLSAEDLSLLAPPLYALGEALGPQVLANGRYQVAVDGIQLNTRSFPAASRMNLVQAFLDSLTASPAVPYREVHPASQAAGDGKADPQPRVAQAMLGNPHWRKLEGLLGQPATDPQKLRAACLATVKALGSDPTPLPLFPAILQLVADGAARQPPKALGAAVQGLCEAFGGKGLDEASLEALVQLALTDPRCGPTQVAAILAGLGQALGAAQAPPAQRDRLLDQVLGTPGVDPKKMQAALAAVMDVLAIDKLSRDDRQAIAVRIQTSLLAPSQQGAMIARLALG